MRVSALLFVVAISCGCAARAPRAHVTFDPKKCTVTELKDCEIEANGTPRCKQTRLKCEPVYEVQKDKAKK